MSPPIGMGDIRERKGGPEPHPSLHSFLGSFRVPRSGAMKLLSSRIESPTLSDISQKGLQRRECLLSLVLSPQQNTQDVRRHPLSRRIALVIVTTLAIIILFIFSEKSASSEINPPLFARHVASASQDKSKLIHSKARPKLAIVKPVPSQGSHLSGSGRIKTRAPLPSKPIVSLSDYAAKLYIYNHESGNNPATVNGSGCMGLGQDCNNVLPKACPNWRTDYKCQDDWWTNTYMKGRYKTWKAAYAFWIRTDCRPYCGHWW